MAARLAIVFMAFVTVGAQAAEWKVRLFWLSRVTSAVVTVDGQAPNRLTLKPA